MTNKKYINNSTKRECNILSTFLNPTKHAKYKISPYSPILQDCMNTCRGRENFKNFRIVLDSGIFSTIVMGNLTSKITSKVETETMWDTKAGKFTTPKKETVYFFLPEFRAKKLVTWKSQVDKSTNCICIMILGRYLLTAMVMACKFYENVTVGVKVPYEG